ncbi:MAG: PDZ domain-containing protein [Thermoguttaceae bacterium]|nr:PDZ domain-containing protein [Thermoguttaceae bacterium]
MNRIAFSNRSLSRRLPLACGVLTACLVGGGIAVAQTKQLKEPAQPTAAEASDANAAALRTANGSFSVVVESKTGPDGKTVQTKKVWRDGQLVESEEKTLEGDAADATIQLPNGQTAPGRVFHFDFDDDVFGGPNASPFEAMRRMEAQMREQEERMRAQFDELRRRLGSNGSLVLSDDSNASIATAPSKYWIGATVEPTPELLVAQLPIEPNQGILLQYIAPDSPAEKAGLKRFDVVVKIDGEPVARAADVAKIVDKAGDKVVKVEFFRKGKLTETKLTPAERPQNLAPIAQSLGGSNGGSRFHIVRPGLIVPTPEAENAESKPAETEENAESKPAETEENAESKPAETKENAAPKAEETPAQPETKPAE